MGRTRRGTGLTIKALRTPNGLSCGRRRLADSGKAGRELNPLLQAALGYARRGLHILTLRPGEKVPATAHGVHDATTDETIIRQWWANNPLYNIGISCGPSGIVGVDIDTKDGKPGAQTWQELTASLGIPENGTLTAITPSGGRHKYFSKPDGVILGNTQGRLGEGLDTRGDGGYLVAPPSVINGTRYRWEDESVPVAPCPEPLIELLTREELPPHPWDAQRTTFSELLSWEPEPVQWIVSRVLEAGTLAVLFGRPGSLKSMLAADLAVCVASGHPWLPVRLGEPGHPRQVTACPVLWFDLDNGSRRTRTRFRALAAARGITVNVPLQFYCMPDQFDLANESCITLIRDTILQYGARLVVIDTLINATSVESENDNAQLRGPLFALRQLCEQTGATILVIHHSSKNARSGVSLDSLRGGSAIGAAADTVLHIDRRNPQDGEVTVTSQKDRGSSMAPFTACWDCVQDDRGVLISGRFFGSCHVAPTANRGEILRERILERLAEGPTNRTSLRELLNCNNERLGAALTALVSGGAVSVTPGPHKSNNYELAR